MIRINGIEKRFNDFSLLIEDISIKGGEIIGLIGNNGAGKTTFLKVVLDLLKPNSGIVKNFEVDIDKSEAWKPNTGAYLDEDFLITYLKPIEYLTLLRSIKKIEEEEFKKFLGTIEPFCGNLLNSTKYIGELSKGNKQKIGISGALLGDLSLVVLDEPFSNLDPSSSIFLANYFKHRRSKIVFPSYQAIISINYWVFVIDSSCFMMAKLF